MYEAIVEFFVQFFVFKSERSNHPKLKKFNKITLVVISLTIGFIIVATIYNNVTR